ncbi:Malonyl CoA-acyl carrier protein transacylase [Candidatus Erwinia haradaeae]|uniref:Malonyl CoA-acyl carrier protein transacylase n=1 Tax=Candidatus Erwinia haradaeae TaxID=1922217 RepID=A0A451D8I5_9GAMM|nr:Malonyl CoA-acyl carrier protein transacylase [Candidatus Erwinia haradaeae]
MNNIAMVFPGQGSQKIGMLADLAQAYNLVEKTFLEASNVLGYDLWKLVQEGPSVKLNKTYHTQPAILAASFSIFKIWKKRSKKIPSLLAGHSLGEYSALVCSEVLNFPDAITLVELRGKLMQEAVPEGIGSMQVIIGLDPQSIMQICKESSHDQIVSPVNYNSPDQTVIAGHKEAVERASLACKRAGAKLTLPLSVSVPAHCALMKPAAEKLRMALEKIDFHAPIFPVINNVDVVIETKPHAIRNALIRQLDHPIQWIEIIKFIKRKGITCLLEIGPGKTLTGLNRRTEPSFTLTAINDPDSLAKALEVQ